VTAKQLFKGTMPFNIAKLALGGATLLLSAILLAICMGLGWLFGGGGMGVMLILWIIGTGVIQFFLTHYIGYLVKAGQIAVIAEATVTGRIPPNQVAYGKEIVKKRFATSNVYFAVDKLVGGAVRQIQRTVDATASMFSFIPGMKSVAGIANLFVGIFLGYIDECCLGYTFLQKKQNAYKSAADGVVIYAQNWKALIKDGGKTTLKVVLLSIAAVLAVFLPIGLLFKLFGWSSFLAFLFAIMITWVIKFAFLDSYIMIQMMASYLKVAQETQITYDLYGKLCGVSGKFKELFRKGGGNRNGAAEPGTPQ
jgi:hypothetical protein